MAPLWPGSKTDRRLLDEAEEVASQRDWETVLVSDGSDTELIKFTCGGLTGREPGAYASFRSNGSITWG